MVDETNWDIILDAMYGTVNREHGTAFRSFATAPYMSAGKTGTAQLFSVAQDEKYDAETVADHLRRSYGTQNDGLLLRIVPACRRIRFHS
jgi:penicillin-binding protein 2